MNPYAIAALVIIMAALASIGADLSAGIRDGYAIMGGVTAGVAAAIAGILTRLPQKQWTPEERAEKLKTEVKP